MEGMGSDADVAGGWTAARQAAAAAAAAAGSRGGGGSSPPQSSLAPTLTRRSLSDSTPDGTMEQTTRYSGRVLVRGMFRRVWRPRYLELVDDGVLRYFETALPAHASSAAASGGDDASTVASASEGRVGTPPTPTTTTLPTAGRRENESVVLGGTAVIDADWVRAGNGAPAPLSSSGEGWCYVADASPGVGGSTTTTTPLKRDAAAAAHPMSLSLSLSNRPKAVLLVLTARVIDIHSIRDMHIGLPRGSYGFVFRAHPHNWAAGSPEPDHVARDYLCAVNSPEEAHEWVTALRWAASFHNLRPAPSTPLARLRTPHAARACPIATAVPSGAGATRVAAAVAAKKDCPSPPNLRLRANTGGENAGFLPSADIPTSVIARSPHRATATLGSSRSLDTEDNGYTVVTKVSRHRLCRLTSVSSSRSTPFLPWSPAKFKVVFEVRMLLLRSDHLAPEDEKATSVTPIAMEERTVYRTFSDFCSLVLALLEEISSSLEESFRHSASAPSGVATLDCSQRKQLSSIRKALKELSVLSATGKTATSLQARGKMKHRRVMSTSSTDSLGSCSSSSGTSVAALADLHALQDAARSVAPCCGEESHLTRESQPDYLARVDSVLRRLTGNADLCNSTAMRDFLNMQRQAVGHCKSREGLEDFLGFLVIREDCFLKTTLKSTLRVAPGHCTDDFVRRWMAAAGAPPSGADVWRVRLAVLLQSNYVATVVSCLMLWASSRLAGLWWAWCSVVVAVRVDILLVAIACAFLLGRESSGRSASVSKRLSSSSSALSSRSRSKKLTRTKKAAVHEASSLPKSPGAVDASPERVQATPPEDEEVTDDGDEDECFRDDEMGGSDTDVLPSPLPLHPANGGVSTWSRPPCHKFRVRSASYFQDKVKMPSATEIFRCRGVDVWLTDNPASHIARHPSVLGGKVAEEDTFIVNFLLPFCNLVACFSVPPLEEFPPTVRRVWQKFLAGDQQYRDRRLKLLPVVVEGPWIVRKAVGPGTSPALLGKVVPLQYYFTPASGSGKKAVYEVDVIISASRIAKGILSVVKGHTKCLTIAFALIVEASEQEDLPETVLASFCIHELHLEECPHLPDLDLDNL